MTAHRWRGTLAELAEAEAHLEASGSYSGRGGTYPNHTRSDFEVAARAAKLLDPTTPLSDAPDLVAVAQAYWHASGANACTFAAYLSDQRIEYGWDTYVFTESSVSSDTVLEVASSVRPSLVEPDVEVVSVLLPRLDDERELARLLARLNGLADWEIEDGGLEEDEHLGVVRGLGLRVAVEFDHWSEVLGFGQFATQPNTRLAPFTELAIRAKGPKKPRRDRRSFMANIDIERESTDVGEWWHETKRERHDRLAEAQEFRGKARSTFSIREDIWIQES